MAYTRSKKEKITVSSETAITEAYSRANVIYIIYSCIIT